MASPFRVFRKNQKLLLVIASVMAIFAFVIGDSLFTYMTGGRNARQADQTDMRAVAVQWDGGKLTNRQVNELVSRRRILNAFLRQVQGEGEVSARQAGVDPPPLRVRQLLGPDSPQEGIEQHVVRTRLFADAARDAGMSVSDETIVQYLDDLGRKNVTRERMRSILNGMQIGGGHASIDYVIDALRDEMLANNFILSQQYAFETITPEQRWKDWRLVNERVVIEAVPIATESFLPEVKEPTDAELEKLFNEYKDREKNPETFANTELPASVPGFKIPRKVDLQFVEAKYDDYLAKEEAKITDTEISKYYDEHKNLFEKADTKLMEDISKKKEGEKKESPEAKNGAADTSKDAKPADADKKSPEAENKNAPAESEKEKKPAATPENKTETKSPPDSKSPPANGEDKKDEPPAAEKKSSDRTNPSKSVFRLAAFEEKAEKKNGEAEKTSPPADEKKDGPEAKAATPTNPPTAETKSGDAAKPPAATPDPGAAAPGAPATGPNLPAAATPPATPPAAKPVQYQPLSEVKDLIRRQLAEGKVAEQLTQLTGQVQTQLEADFNKWFNDKLTAEADKRPVPAAPKALADLAPIAEKNGLKAVRTGPKSALELRDMPVGKSSSPDSGRGLLSLLFAGHELDLYQPVSTVDIDGNHYVVIKMSDTPARVPTFAEVKNEVVRAWKFQKAAELAKKRAEDLAKKATDSKEPLAKVFADDKDLKFIHTDPFSFLTGGDVSFVTGQQQPFRLSQPTDIVAPGPEFMRRVFELKDGEVVVAQNHDDSIAYVIRLVQHQPGMNELRTAYLAEADSWPGRMSMAQQHFQEAMGIMARDIIAGANLKWERTPDKTRDERGDEG